MIKKISLIIFLYCILISCGKKGDPEYKEPKNLTKLTPILVLKS